MGMAASQARLLSITARLTNNENSGQSISYSKQRLADQTQQITNEYNEALNTTKLTVLTGFNGSEATYTDISYNTMTGHEMAANTKQYVVTDTKGKVLVTKTLADKYAKAGGDYNQFLANLGYSQSDITVQKTYGNDTTKRTEEQAAAEQKIHEAWDKYFATVGINIGDNEHDFGFSWTETIAEGGDTTNNNDYAIGRGYAGYLRTNEAGQPVDANGNVLDKANDADKLVYDPINYEGTTDEQKELFDYAMSITEAYLRTNEGKDAKDKNRYHVTYQMNNDASLKSAANSDNKAMLNYYKNIFSKMQSSGYFTYSETPADAVNDPEHYKYASVGTGTAGNVQKSPLKDNTVFEAALRDGSLRLEYYSTTSKSFKTTTISEDNCIQEVSDERAIAKAESKYNQDMADLENQDKKLDLELKKLDTEHSALQTEYESVKNVVDKNVQNSFKTFG